MAARPLRGGWDRLDRGRVPAMQAKRLRRYLRHVVVPFSPFYRGLFARAGIDPADLRRPGDLARIPFTTRADLLDGPGRAPGARDFVLSPDRAVLLRRVRILLRALVSGRRALAERLEREFRPVLLTSTTGRSAESIPFLYTRRDLENLKTAGRRLIEVLGVARDERILNLFPYAPHLAFWQTHYAATAAGLFCLSTGGGRALGMDRNLRLLERVRPGVVLGMPTFLYHVLRRALEDGRRAEGLRVLVLGGEKAPAGMRRKLRALAAALGSPGVRVAATYGFTEAKMAWTECGGGEDEEPSGYHLYPDLGIVEVVDPETGRPLPEGAPGEVVFTPLDARGTVVLRYRTGDVVAGGLVTGSCPGCGRTGPRLVGSIARRSEVRDLRLEKVKGTLVDFNALEEALDDLESLGAWQIEIRKLHDDPYEVDRLVMHVERSPSRGRKGLLEELNRRLSAGTELRLNEVRFHSAGEMRRLLGVGKELKELRVVDRRPAPAAPEATPPVAGLAAGGAP